MRRKEFERDLHENMRKMFKKIETKIEIEEEKQKIRNKRNLKIRKGLNKNRK